MKGNEIMMHTSRFGIVVGCALLFACGGSGASVESGGGDASDAAASMGDAGAPAGDAGAADTSTSSDGAAHVDGGDGATADDRIDPLAVGRSWTYSVTQIGNYPLCPAGTHDGTVNGESTKDGKHAFEVRSLCANGGTFFYSVAGDVVQFDAQGTWVLALDAPVQEGHSWTNGVTTYTWHAAGTVTVPAGTFDRCFQAKDDNSESYTTFCRGVGPIKWHYKDTTGNGYDAVMTAKSF